MHKKFLLPAVLGTSLAFGLIAGCGTDSKNPAESLSPPSPARNPAKINLSSYNRDVVINKAGAYSLSGVLDNHAVIVDTLTGTTSLSLNNARIISQDSPAIIGASGGELIVSSKDNTVNVIFSGNQNNEQDGAVYSRIPLFFKGGGSLNITSQYQQGIGALNQDIVFQDGNYNIVSSDDGISAYGERSNDIIFNGGRFYIKSFDNGIDASGKVSFNGADVYAMGSDKDGDSGIDTNGGYTINSGRIISLGSDMEIADEASLQYTMCFIFESEYEEGSAVVLKDSNDKEIIAFEADEKFKTLVLSDKDLAEGTYRLYINGGAVSIGGKSEFEIMQGVNTYGSAE